MRGQRSLRQFRQRPSEVRRRVLYSNRTVSGRAGRPQRRNQASAFSAKLHAAKEVLVEIESGLIRGSFPRRALRLLFEWIELHKEELEKNWARARDRQPLEPIPPLP